MLRDINVMNCKHVLMILFSSVFWNISSLKFEDKIVAKVSLQNLKSLCLMY